MAAAARASRTLVPLVRAAACATLVCLAISASSSTDPWLERTIPLDKGIGVQSLAWMPDGKSLLMVWHQAFVSRYSPAVSLVDISTGKRRDLVLPEHLKERGEPMGLISDSPVISPDGATLAVRRWPNPGAETRLEGLWFITVATGAKRQVVQNAAIRPLAWARNGRGVYVAIHRTGEEYDLCFVERYGAITRGSRAGTITAASVSLDDRWVAFESWTRGEPSVQVWDRQTNAVSTVERTAWSPCWQDDALLYIRGGTNIVRWRPGGKSETLFPTSGSFNGHFDRLDAPPRGNVVLASQGGGGYFMVALGAKPIHGVNGGNGRVPALSPDARLVACVDQAGGALQAPPEIKLRRSEL